MGYVVCDWCESVRCHLWFREDRRLPDLQEFHGYFFNSYSETVLCDTSILSGKFSDMSLSAALEPKHMPVSVQIPLTSVKTTELW